jgi:hypothetical protein
VKWREASARFLRDNTRNHSTHLNILSIVNLQVPYSEWIAGGTTISDCSPFLEIAFGGRPGLTTSLREPASVLSKGQTMNDELVLATGAGCKSRALH